MPSVWGVAKRAGTGDWMVTKDGVQHGRSHAKEEEAKRAAKNFQLDEKRQEDEAAKKKQGGK